ncbi:MAG: hypothetical protein C0391_02640, partial [Anaerolinea sp.]|nr:hypothetical protein [Anaerolinea sp.]
PAVFTCLAVHPVELGIAGGDNNGMVYLLRLIGRNAGVPYKVPFRIGMGYSAICPKCGSNLNLNAGMLGSQVKCTNPTCNQVMIIDPVAVTINATQTKQEDLKKKRSWW